MQNGDKVSSEIEQAFNISFLLKKALSEAIIQSGMSVHQIAARIAEMTGYETTGSTLYNWSSQQHPHMPRIEILPALCFITRNYKPIQVLCQPLTDIRLIDRETFNLLKIIQMRNEIETLKKELKNYYNEVEQ